MKTVGEFLNASKDISNVVNNLKNGVITYKESFGLLSQAMSKYSLEAVKSTLIDSGLDKAQIRLILSSKGLKDKTLEEAVAQVMDAQAKKVNKEATEDLTEKELALKYAVGGLKDTIIKFATSTVGKLTIATTALALLGTKIYNLQKADEEALESSKEKLDELSSEYESVTSEVESLESQVSSLNNQIDELDPITDDAQIKKLKEERAELEQELAILKERQTYLNAETAKAAEDALKQTSSSQYSYDNYEQTSSMYTDDVGANAGLTIGHIIANQGVADQVTEYEELILAMEEVNKLEKERQELETQQGQYTNDTEKWNEYKEKIANVDDQIENVKTHASTLASSVQSSWSELADGEFKDEISEILFKYFEFSDAVDAATASFEALNAEQQKNILIGKLQEQSLDDNQIQSIMSNISEEDYTDLYSVDWSEVAKPNVSDYDTYEEYGKAFAQAWLDGLSSGIESGTDDVTSSIETLNENINTAYDSISKSYDALEKFKSAMSSGMTDSALDAVAGLSDELKVLVAEFYAGAVSTDELFEALTEHYNDDLKAYGDALIEKNLENAEFYESLGLRDEELTNWFYENYEIDIRNCKNHAEAREQIEATLISKYGEMWSKYYDAQAQATTAEYERLKTLMSDPELQSRAGVEFMKQVEAEFNVATEMINSYKEASDALNNITYNGIASNFSTKATSSNSSSSSKKTFDHIETALSNMEDALSDLDSKVADTYSTWTERNNALTQSINKTKEAIQLQYNAYSAYMSMANSVGLSDFYKNLVHNGAMNISVITDETLAEQISKYQDYYEKAQACLDTANELQSTLNEISSSEKWDLIKSESDANISELDAYLDSVQTSIDKLELQGKFANTSFYEDMYNLSVNKITVLKNQADQLSNILGTMSKDTEAYDTMFEELLSIRQEISELENDCIEFNNNIRDLNWEVFEYLENSISRINDEMDYLVGLLANEDLFDENGKRTRYADATIALHAASYDVYKQQAEDYKEEMLSLQEQLVNGNMDVLEQYYNMVDAHQDAINAANDEKQAILDLVRDGYEAQKDVLQDVIDKKKELLNVEKSTYDYQKTIQDLVDERDSIQKQILAYKNDTSESGRSTLQQLESKLADVESQIEETEYEKYLSDLEQMYDLLTSEYEEWINQRIDNSDALLQEIIGNLQTEGDEINATLTEVAEKNGTLISDSITSIFDAQSPFTSGLTNISNGVAGTTTAINNLIAKVEGIAGILSASNAGTVSGTGGSSTTTTSITSTPTNVSTSSTPTVTTTTSTNTTTTSTSSNSSSSGWESALVYSKYLGDKNKLNTNTSIVDLLKKHDKSAAWNDRANLYYAMGGSGTYRGSSSQNRFMIDTMKAKGYKKGSSNIPYDQMSWIHDGEIVLKRVSDGGYLTDLTAASKVLTEEQVQNMLNWSKMNPQILKPNVNLPSMPVVQNAQMPTSSIGDVSISIELPNIQSYEDFMTKAQNDSRFEGMIQQIAFSKNPMSKYKYKWN